MGGQKTDVIYHHPGSEDYENKTTHHVSISGPKLDEARDLISKLTSAKQIFPCPHDPLMKTCVFEFPPHMTPAEIETELFDPKLRLDGGRDAELRFHIKKPR